MKAYYVILVQYAARLNADKLKKLVHQMNGGCTSYMLWLLCKPLFHPACGLMVWAKQRSKGRDEL
eukprot:982009-Pelagomonas_calceolata.AAC.3